MSPWRLRYNVQIGPALGFVERFEGLKCIHGLLFWAIYSTRVEDEADSLLVCFRSRRLAYKLKKISHGTTA